MQTVLSSLEQAQTLVILGGLAFFLLWESAHPFFDFFRDAPHRRVRHAARNLALGMLNAALIALVFVGLWLVAAVWAEERDLGLLHALEAAGAPAWTRIAGALVLLDAWTYLWHRLNHVLPFLWRFHRVHHADTFMDVTTANRFHLGEIVLSSLLRVPLIVLLGLRLEEIVLYEILMFTVVQFHHANVILPDRLDRVLRLVIVTPAMHKVHHSCWRPETDSNYGALFSFWDRLGRSFRLRKNLAEIRFGLGGETAERESLLSVLRTPFAAPAGGPAQPETTEPEAEAETDTDAGGEAALVGAGEPAPYGLRRRRSAG